MNDILHIFIASSERAYRRSDEADVEFRSPIERKVGDTFISDGIEWVVEEVIQ